MTTDLFYPLDVLGNLSHLGAMPENHDFDDHHNDRLDDDHDDMYDQGGDGTAQGMSGRWFPIVVSRRRTWYSSVCIVIMSNINYHRLGIHQTTRHCNYRQGGGFGIRLVSVAIVIIVIIEDR